MVFSAIKPRDVLFFFFLKKIVFNRFLTFVDHFAHSFINF